MLKSVMMPPRYAVPYTTGTLLSPDGGSCTGLPGFDVASLLPKLLGEKALLMIADATILIANAAIVIPTVKAAAAVLVT